VEEIMGRKFDFVVSRAVAPLKDLYDGVNLRESRAGVQSLESGSNPEHTITNPGLICLKGGDLALEIQESGYTPRIMEIHDIFSKNISGKILLYVPCQNTC
jgi:16S rRNA (guanine527-N7)-methyltransferase